jgi:hypothetical protein
MHLDGRGGGENDSRGMQSGENPEPHPDDAVELDARREGDSMIMRLTRDGAQAEAEQLETEGWTVEIVEVDA